MEQIEFTELEVFKAYKKLKHYFYYDNTSLFIRQKIADFEKEIENLSPAYESAFRERMRVIAGNLNRKGIRYWQDFFKQKIDYRVTPKSLYKKPSFILTNRSQQNELPVERINLFIDAPIEVHIISVLWLMRVGKHLGSWVDKDNYAYQLEIKDDEKEEVVDGLRLYKPYFIQYQNWRDKAIAKAEQLVAEKKDVVILSLDIKDYFHSVKLDMKKIEVELYKKKSFLQNDAHVNKLFRLLNAINIAYTKKIQLVKRLPDLEEGESILPVGLLSSGLLGNIYLKEFDTKVKDALNPAYYGRYVDDLLFVLTNVEVNQDALSPINTFLDRYFIERGLLSVKFPTEVSDLFIHKDSIVVNGNDSSKYRYKEPDVSALNECDLSCRLLEVQKLKFCIEVEPSLIIQSKKVILQDIDHKESPAILNNFKKNLDKNRSEFRYLPDEDEVEKEFDEEAFSLHYNDSLNKLRSIKEFNEDKYGASKYLAGKIFATSLTSEKSDKKTTTQILTFFKGDIGISFHTLWEKVATYFIINEDADALVKFYYQCKNSISKLDLSKYEDKDYSHAIGIRFKSDLENYLTIAICTPLAFNPTFTAKGSFEKIVTQELVSIAKSIRAANMFRHAWVGLPAINFTEYLFEDDSTNNLLKISNEYEKREVNPRVKKFLSRFGKLTDLSVLELNRRLFLLAPRYVHFHEVNILEIYKVVHSVDAVKEEVVNQFDNLPNEAFKKYWKINQAWKQLDNPSSDVFIEERQKEYFELIPSGPTDDHSNGSGKGLLIDIKNKDEKSAVRKKVALANIKVDKNNIRRSYLGYPNTSRERRQTLFNLINLVEEAGCDLFVLPEVSIPYQWIGLLAFLSQRRNIGIVAGLEHWVNKNNFAFNFMVTILPIKRHRYNTCLIKIRLKNHYSHEEVKQLKGYRLLIPGESFAKHLKHYDLFHWRKSYFPVYNCFELADINDRCIFKSRVDFIVASEYNKDTNYFSEIAGSWVRDIHCFFIQVNSSDYGDSRVIQPSSSVSKNILQIKGGDNSTILVGEIPISDLREFQLKEYSLQKEDSRFKPTPPDFNRENVSFRIKNKKLRDYGI